MTFETRPQLDDYSVSSEETSLLDRQLDEGVVSSGRCSTGAPWRSAAARVLANERAVLVELGRVLVFVFAQTIGLAVHRFVIAVQRPLTVVRRLVAVYTHTDGERCQLSSKAQIRSRRLSPKLRLRKVSLKVADANHETKMS